MTWCLAAGDSLADAFRHGVAAGTAAVLNPGTELCRRADVMRLREQVELLRLTDSNFLAAE
jgi:6-phosphofructokinase 2